MSASSPNKVTRLIVLCCLLSASVANSETFTSVTADTVNADTVNTGVINATTGNVTTLNATNLNISGTVSLDAIGVSVEDLEYMGGTLSGIEGIGVDGGGASAIQASDGDFPSGTNPPSFLLPEFQPLTFSIFTFKLKMLMVKACSRRFNYDVCELQLCKFKAIPSTDTLVL